MLLRTENITLNIGGLQVLRDVTVDIEQGETTSIIGPNGAGKTTLFNVITGRMSPTKGKVFFKDKEVTDFPPFRIAGSGIARSFQITNIFKGMSVFDNICIAAQTKSIHRCNLFSSASKDQTISNKAQETLALVGLEGLKYKLAGELSHGDQRRLEIGMSLAIDPELLLLDEPTSGMSPLETEATVGLIESLSKRVTICFIEHKMNLVMTLSDKIIVLNLGEKVAEGTPHDVASNEKVQEVYLGTV